MARLRLASSSISTMREALALRSASLALKVLQVALQRGELGGQRAHVGGLGGSFEPLLDLAPEAIEALGEPACLGADGGQLAVETGDARPCGLAGLADRALQLGEPAREHPQLRRGAGGIG